MTSDFSSTANGSDARERAERALRNFATPPRSPYEELEPVRPPEFPEREPWRMHPVLAFFNALFMLVLFTACALLALFYFLRLQFDLPGPLTTSTVVVIPKGEGVSGIALGALDLQDDVEVFLGEVPLGARDLDRQILGRGGRTRHRDGDGRQQSHAESRHEASEVLAMHR